MATFSQLSLNLSPLICFSVCLIGLARISIKLLPSLVVGISLLVFVLATCCSCENATFSPFTVSMVTFLHFQLHPRLNVVLSFTQPASQPNSKSVSQLSVARHPMETKSTSIAQANQVTTNVDCLLSSAFAYLSLTCLLLLPIAIQVTSQSSDNKPKVKS